MIFLLIPFSITFIPLIVWVIKITMEVKIRILKSLSVLILSLVIVFSFFIMMVSLGRGVSVLDLLKNSKHYYLDYPEYLFSLLIGILPLITIFFYGGKELFSAFSKEKLILIPLLLFCAFPSSLMGAGFYFGPYDVLPFFKNNQFIDAFSPFSDYPLGLFLLIALLITYCIVIFIFFCQTRKKHELLCFIITISILIISFLITNYNTLSPKEIAGIMNEARRSGSIEECDKIKGREIDIKIENYKCIKEIAILKKDENLCEKLPNSYKYGCYEQIAEIKKDPSLCKNSSCYYDLALILWKPELCNKIDSDWSWQKCLLNTRAFSNPKICETVENEERKNYCLLRLFLIGTVKDQNILKGINWEKIYCQRDIVDLYQRDQEKCLYYKNLYVPTK